MAPRWLQEGVKDTVTHTVTYELTRREVTVSDEEIASPGGRRPMVRSYLVISTPQALQV